MSDSPPLPEFPSSDPAEVRNSLKCNLQLKHPEAGNLIELLFEKILLQACENQKLPTKKIDQLLCDSSYQKQLELEIEEIVVSAGEDNFSLLPEGLSAEIYDRIGFLFQDKKLAKHLTQYDYFSALIWKQDPTIFRMLREDFQTVFDHLGKSALEEEKKNPLSDRLNNLEVLIGNILAMYTYLHPIDEEELRVPQRVDGKWTTISYRCEWIPMTGDKLGEPYSALGMHPQTPRLAPPLLLFMGTTFPTGRGAFWTYLADVAPKHSVGELIYRQDEKNAIGKWLHSATSAARCKARVCGQSLGGALTMLTALRHPELVDEAKAYAPAALREETVAKYRSAWSKIRKVKIEAFLNEGDIVPNAGGNYPPGTAIYRFLLQSKYNSLYAHLKAMSGHKEYIRLKVEPHAAPKGWLTDLHKRFSFILFPLALIFFWFVFSIKTFLSEKS